MMSSLLPFNITDPVSIDYFIGGLLILLSVSLLVKTAITKAWRSRYGVAGFSVIFLVGIVLIVLREYAFGMIFVLVFVYVLFIIASQRGPGGRKREPGHEN